MSSSPTDLVDKLNNAETAHEEIKSGVEVLTARVDKASLETTSKKATVEQTKQPKPKKEAEVKYLLKTPKVNLLKLSFVFKCSTNNNY